MILQGQAGPQAVADSSYGNVRLGKGGDLVVSEFAGRYYELVARGQVFSIQAAAVTYAATGNTPLTANTGVPVVGVFNPANSGKNLMILWAGIVTTSGTPGGPFHWNVIPSPTGITATGTAPLSLLTYQSAGSVAKGFANSAVTGSATGVYLRPFGGPAAVAAGAGLYGATEDVAGSIVVPPGAFVGIAGTAVGTSHVISSGLVWAEVTPY